MAGLGRKRVAILPSHYIPWKGYFDIIHDVDVFVFHDDLQYTKDDWRNRNRIKTPEGVSWLTIPVGTSEHRRVCDVQLPVDASWSRAHWRQLEAAYRRAPHFHEYRDYFRRFYLDGHWKTLSDLNQALIIGISRDLLGLTTRFEQSSDYCLTDTKSAGVLELLAATHADVYISASAAKVRVTDEQFAEAGVEVVLKEHAGYPQYPQLNGPFCHEVTILDLLFNTGPMAPWFIWGWRYAAGRAAAA